MKASLLRVYLGDFDKFEHHVLYELLLSRAQEAGLAGCTVLRGFWGYGARGFIHTDISVETAGERPVLIEIVDTHERVAGFARAIAPLIEKAGGLVTEREVRIHRASDPIGNPSPEEKMEKLLRIFIGESDQFDHRPLHDAIVETCKALGMAGCTTFQGVMGYGASSVIHKPHLFRVSQDVPLVIEVVDSGTKIQALLAAIRPMLQGALVTEEKVQVHHYSARPDGA